jgi:hypothetical protein
MYKNNTKIFVVLGIWSVVVVFAVLGAIVSLGVLFDDKPFPDPVPMTVMFLFMASVNIFLIVMYFVRFKMIGSTIRFNNLFMADEDGYVPASDLSKETGVPEFKVIQNGQKLIRKGYLINVNYNASEKAFLLSDKIGRPVGPQLQGVPENKPFLGVYCPGCAASLKIRANTKGNCPYCGREIIAPPYKDPSSSQTG